MVTQLMLFSYRQVSFVKTSFSILRDRQINSLTLYSRTFLISTRLCRSQDLWCHCSSSLKARLKNSPWRFWQGKLSSTALSTICTLSSWMPNPMKEGGALEMQVLQARSLNYWIFSGRMRLDLTMSPMVWSYSNLVMELRAALKLSRNFSPSYSKLMSYFTFFIVQYQFTMCPTLKPHCCLRSYMTCPIAWVQLVMKVQGSLFFIACRKYLIVSLQQRGHSPLRRANAKMRGLKFLSCPTNRQMLQCLPDLALLRGVNLYSMFTTSPYCSQLSLMRSVAQKITVVTSNSSNLRTNTPLSKRASSMQDCGRNDHEYRLIMSLAASQLTLNLFIIMSAIYSGSRLRDSRGRKFIMAFLLATILDVRCSDSRKNRSGLDLSLRNMLLAMSAMGQPSRASRSSHLSEMMFMCSYFRRYLGGGFKFCMRSAKQSAGLLIQLVCSFLVCQMSSSTTCLSRLQNLPQYLHWQLLGTGSGKQCLESSG